MNMNMDTKDLTNDAKSILLICGRFGKSDVAKPFSLGEYNRLTDWMLDKRIRPADLLTGGQPQLLETLPREIDGERVKRLLERRGNGTGHRKVDEQWCLDYLPQ